MMPRGGFYRSTDTDAAGGRGAGMRQGRATRIWAVGGLGLISAGLAGAYLATRPGAKAPMATASAPISTTEGLKALEARAEAGAMADGLPAAVTEAEGSSMVEGLSGVAKGFARLGPTDRMRAIAVAGRVLDRLGIDPAPPSGVDALEPSHAILLAGIGDRSAEVRARALDLVGTHWQWGPGRVLSTAERGRLTAWRAGLHGPAVRSLSTAEPGVRAAAVRCLAVLPEGMDRAAGPAVEHVRDADPVVRGTVLAAFARRREALPEEAILPLLHDPYPQVVDLAVSALKARGLSIEQVGLCKLIGHPRPAMRSSAITLLKGRTDVDPVAWLLHLTHDPVATVRVEALEALAADHPGPEAVHRAEELIGQDPEPAVQTAARALLPKAEATATLPPLPGSSRLVPKAN